MEGEFDNMTIADLEAMVGKKIAKAEVRGQWVECTFSSEGEKGAAIKADVRLLIRKW